MNAAEARRITNENLEEPLIEKFVDAITKEILNKARSGECSLDPWRHLANLRTPSPKAGEREAIKQHFIKAGYKWEDYENPHTGNPDHPFLRPYTILSW